MNRWGRPIRLFEILRQPIATRYEQEESIEDIRDAESFGLYISKPQYIDFHQVLSSDIIYWCGFYAYAKIS